MDIWTFWPNIHINPFNTKHTTKFGFIQNRSQNQWFDLTFVYSARGECKGTISIQSTVIALDSWDTGSPDTD